MQNAINEWKEDEEAIQIIKIIKLKNVKKHLEQPISLKLHSKMTRIGPTDNSINLQLPEILRYCSAQMRLIALNLSIKHQFLSLICFS